MQGAPRAPQPERFSVWRKSRWGAVIDVPLMNLFRNALMAIKEPLPDGCKRVRDPGFYLDFKHAVSTGVSLHRYVSLLVGAI